MFRNVHAIRRIVGALAVAAVLTTAIPAEAAGSSRPAAPGLWESVLSWFGEWTGVGPVLGRFFGPDSPQSSSHGRATGQSDEGPLIDPLGGLSGTRATSIPIDPNGGQI
ncbi:MAG TPA: hypothetical protein VHU81_13755 [Thermoanaerobaculia bacterium]|jgi:hypothetical protein|nr:hypothetical protein [Thermoanaerobaculia bacterium]